MINKTRLIINGDRTVTDSETSLMWTASVFGQLPNGAISEGGGKGFTWQEATKLFGRGRKIPEYGPRQDICRDTYKGYKFAKTAAVFIAQYTDWRLPTLEEVRSLTDADNYDGVFGKHFVIHVWTATYAGFVDRRFEGAWLLYGGGNLVGQQGVSSNEYVRLVRGGTVFNSVFR